MMSNWFRTLFGIGLIVGVYLFFMRKLKKTE